MIRFVVTRPGFMPLGEFETIDDANAAAQRLLPDGAKYFVEARDLEQAFPEPEACEVLEDLERLKPRCPKIRWAGVAP